MTDLRIDRFAEFFQALHGHPPYPWQQSLAKRAAEGGWPGAIDLPTGSGKTACIDIAVFTLACKASLPIEQRIAPRRIFFCVNRRVIVDEAHQRAQRIAAALLKAERNGQSGNEVLRSVASSLRRLAGTQPENDAPPLDVLELRGGIYRDNRWARSITQPTIVCTTIDQLGSRLLFHGYGVSSNAAPIQAALIAYDSLILLDEAHITRPFLQTLEYVRRYLDPQKWPEQDIGVKAAIVVPMTATPTEEMVQRGVIQLEDDDRDDQKNPLLSRRLTASKAAKLRDVNDIAKGAADAATELAKDKPTAVGIIVNRVATAKTIYEQLRQRHTDATVELVIGSMRPIDRDAQAERLRGLVGPGRPNVTEQTSFIVATQCLEVGADYDFDALVTECASLDALRQRFGRLDRGGRKDAEGKLIDARAVILGSKKELKPDEKLDDDTPLDPIYGNALARTWNWLKEHATDSKIDLGIDAFSALLGQHDENRRIPANLLAPSASLDAPVMLPAYVDFWCQTAPHPVPDPDVALFLHGPRRGEPDVQVCWRADTGDAKDHPKMEQWCDVVALLPPTSAECMCVPISRVRRWLANETDRAADDGDVLGVATADESDEKYGDSRRQGRIPRGVLWRGARDSVLIKSPEDLRPGDTLVFPVSAGGWDVLGHIPEFRLAPTDDTGADGRTTDDDAAETPDSTESGAARELDSANIDAAEDAFRAARDRAVLRLHPSLRSRLPAGAAVDELFARAADFDDPPTVAEWRNLLSAAADSVTGEQGDLKPTLDHLADGGKGLICERYADGRGVVLTTRKRIGAASAWFLPPLDDGEDEPSHTQREQPVLLTDHTEHVLDTLRSTISSLPLNDFADAFRFSAKLHDLGKADERFQAMLRQSSRSDAYLAWGRNAAIWAKSPGKPQTLTQYRPACDRAALPAGFRHEMLSVQLANRSGRLPEDATMRDLVLHLIAAHHGHARPFAPVVIDEEWPGVEVEDVQLSHEQRKQLVPPHRLDSGIPERFWSLTRRFGWWGLAYLEAVLRLADQQASAAEDAGEYGDAKTTAPAETTCMTLDHPTNTAPNAAAPTNTDRGVLLFGLDGANPIGFLAALGTLRALMLAWPDRNVKMSWINHGGAWRPVIHLGESEAEDSVVSTIVEAMPPPKALFDQQLLNDSEATSPKNKKGEPKWRDKLRFPVPIFRKYLQRVQAEASVGDRLAADVAAALASESEAELVDKVSVARRTGFDFTAGNQAFVNMARKIRGATSHEQIRDALFRPWRYCAADISMRWDPLDEGRRYALHAVDPQDSNKNPILSVPGANVLAIMGLPFFPLIPVGSRAEQPGVSRASNERERSFSWPIWCGKASVAVVASLLAQDELVAPRPSGALRDCGIVSVFRSRIVLPSERYRNFTPARRIA